MSYAPRRWSSYRSLSEQDEIPPETKAISPDTLLNICIENVLRSSFLAGEAGRTLPSVQAHYILYLALKRLINGESKSYLILHKLISGWSQSELSFNFQSNHLVQSHVRSSASSWRSCLIPPFNYYGIKGVAKSRFELCARDIAVGLFNYAYYADMNDTVTRDDKKAGLEIVDLSEIQFAMEPHPIWGTG